MGTNRLNMLAADFGASSGRTILGQWDGSHLTIQEMYRFANDPVQLGGRLYWDFLRLFHELKKGISEANRHCNRQLSSIAVDTWGVDYGVVDGTGHLLGNPIHYRDARNQEAMDELLSMASGKELFLASGIQPLSFNTLFQLYADQKEARFAGIQDARALLMPDLFRYYLSGEKSAEYTIASTTGLLDSSTRSWNHALLDKLPVAGRLYQDLVMPGTKQGLLRKSVAEELNTGRLSVIATASHDTASAFAAMPVQSGNAAIISCGTWSLMGIELDAPIVTESCYELGFTNEGGAEGKTRLLKNIMGLWLLQECQRQWQLEGDTISFADMQQLAREAQGVGSYVNPDDPYFLPPGNMPQRIQYYCKQTVQTIPQTKPEIIRCVVESLAMSFRQTMEEIEFLTGRRIDQIYMGGGGIQNRLLCEVTANVSGKTVIAGPVEATAIGNLMMQAKAHGEVGTLAEIRHIVLASFPPAIYTPEEPERWLEAYHKFSLLYQKTS